MVEIMPGPVEFLFFPLMAMMGLVPLAVAVAVLVFVVRISNTLDRIERHLAAMARGAGGPPPPGAAGPPD